MRTVFLIDGAFFLLRYRKLSGSRPPQRAANALHAMCLAHLRRLGRKRSQLYRIFYYDCPPLTKVHDPLTGRPIDFSKTAVALWRFSFLEELKKLRKVALRMGYLNERSGFWTLKSEAIKDLLAGRIAVKDLTDSHFRYDVQQKGVDMRIGLDIASLAYKRIVDQIVLVAGDSDFVPAAKLARREGLDFILDPMWSSIRDDLHEHIDGLQTVFRRPAPPSQASAPIQATGIVQPAAPPQAGSNRPIKP